MLASCSRAAWPPERLMGRSNVDIIGGRTQHGRNMEGTHGSTAAQAHKQRTDITHQATGDLTHPPGSREHELALGGGRGAELVHPERPCKACRSETAVTEAPCSPDIPTAASQRYGPPR